MFTSWSIEEAPRSDDRGGGQPEGEVALMLNELLLYLLGTLTMVGGILLLERIVAGPHATAGTGYARVDSAFDFDRLRWKQYRSRMSSVLRRGGRSTLPLLQEVTGAPRQL